MADAFEDALEAAAPGDDAPRPIFDNSFMAELQAGVTSIANGYQTVVDIDVAFLAFLRKMARFGFFTFGPITIDVLLIEDLFARTVERGTSPGPDQHFYDPSYVRFTRKLVDEVRASGRRRVDELHYLLAFMRVNEGLPKRVFGELGVTPEQVEQFARNPRGGDALEKLYSPEEAAEYLGVHVQTVRGWIRSGRLPASRLAGQRSLRIRSSDLASVLEPVDPDEF